MDRETAPAAARPVSPVLPRGPRRVVLLLTLLAYWLVCFAPFDWVAPANFKLNEAQLVADPRGASEQPALVFTGVGAVELPTSGVSDWQIAPKSLQLFMTLGCSAAQQYGPARVITLSHDTLQRNFMLGQEGSALVLRLFRPGSTINGVPDYRVEGFFANCRMKSIALSIRTGALELKVDGVSRLQIADSAITLDRWYTTYPVMLGNEGTWDRGWEGTIHELKLIVDGVVLAQDLRAVVFPPGGWRLSERAQRTDRFVLVPFSKRHPYVWLDIALNILGFLPFGVLLAVGWPMRLSWRSAGVIAALLSCSIELGQIGFEGRVPSTTDVVTNTTGGIIGFLIGHYLLRRYRGATL